MIPLFVYFTAADLQQEVENLALRLFYVNNAKEDVRSDINVMKRAAERADAEVSAAESQKQKQVPYNCCWLTHINDVTMP